METRSNRGDAAHGVDHRPEASLSGRACAASRLFDPVNADALLLNPAAWSRPLLAKFRDLDQDQNDKLTSDEVMEKAMRRLMFERIDANKDCVVTLAFEGSLKERPESDDRKAGASSASVGLPAKSGEGRRTESCAD